MRSAKGFVAVLVAAVMVAAAGAVDPNQPDTRPVGERCHVPKELDDPRAMEVHLRCLLASLGNPVVLPNPFNQGVGEDDAEARDAEQALYDAFCNGVQEALDHLGQLKTQLDASDNKTPTAAAVGDLEELVRSMADAASAMESWLRDAAAAPEGDEGFCRDVFEPNEDGTGPTADQACRALRDPTPDLTVRPDDDDAENGEKGIFANLNAHLIPLPRFGLHHYPKERMTDGQVPDGGAYVVLKEFFGIRFRLHWRWVPIYVEPWYARRRIIGYRRRLYIRLVPCEYLKSIIYERSAAGGAVLPRVVARNWCDYSLLKFWRFF